MSDQTWGDAARQAFRGVALAALDEPHPVLRHLARIVLCGWMFGVLSVLWWALGLLAYHV